MGMYCLKTLTTGERHPFFQQFIYSTNTSLQAPRLNLLILAIKQTLQAFDLSKIMYKFTRHSSDFSYSKPVECGYQMAKMLEFVGYTLQTAAHRWKVYFNGCLVVKIYTMKSNGILHAIKIANPPERALLAYTSQQQTITGIIK